MADLQARLIDYASRVEKLRTAGEVLDELCAITTRRLPLSVLGAVRAPLQSRDWESIRLGQSVFLHKDVPRGWWEEYVIIARGRFRPLLFLAQTSCQLGGPPVDPNRLQHAANFCPGM